MKLKNLNLLMENLIIKTIIYENILDNEFLEDKDNIKYVMNPEDSIRMQSIHYSKNYAKNKHIFDLILYCVYFVILFRTFEILEKSQYLSFCSSLKYPMQLFFVNILFPIASQVSNSIPNKKGINLTDYAIASFILIGFYKYISKLIEKICKSMLKKEFLLENFSSEIPKVVIQTYFDKNKIPQKVYDNISKFGPDYKHIIFDDNEIIDFLKNNFKKDVLKTFNHLKGAHKADLFRYCYLYKYGGVYLDIKTELIKPLDEVFSQNFTYSVISIVRDTIYQGIISTPPGNPIFLKLIKFMVQLVKSKRKYAYIIFTKDFWNNIYRECNIRPYAGMNRNVENKKYNYYLFQEVCSKNKNECYDGLDKYKLCCYICDGGERVIKSRYSDFPWK